jgi:hypothetical protein
MREHRIEHERLRKWQADLAIVEVRAELTQRLDATQPTFGQQAKGTVAEFEQAFGQQAPAQQLGQRTGLVRELHGAGHFEPFARRVHRAAASHKRAQRPPLELRHEARGKQGRDHVADRFARTAPRIPFAALQPSGLGAFAALRFGGKVAPYERRGLLHERPIIAGQHDRALVGKLQRSLEVLVGGLGEPQQHAADRFGRRQVGDRAREETMRTRHARQRTEHVREIPVRHFDRPMPHEFAREVLRTTEFEADQAARQQQHMVAWQLPHRIERLDVFAAAQQAVQVPGRVFARLGGRRAVEHFEMERLLGVDAQRHRRLVTVGVYRSGTDERAAHGREQRQDLRQRTIGQPPRMRQPHRSAGRFAKTERTVTLVRVAFVTQQQGAVGGPEQRHFFGRQRRRARHAEFAAAFAFARAQRHIQTAVVARAAVRPRLQEELEYGLFDRGIARRLGRHDAGEAAAPRFEFGPGFALRADGGWRRRRR